MINLSTLTIILSLVLFNYSVLSDESDKVTTSSSDFETETYDEIGAKKIFDNWDKNCIVRMNTNGTWRKKL